MRNAVFVLLFVAACGSGERLRVHAHELVVIEADTEFKDIVIGEASEPHVFTVRPAPLGLQDDEIEAISSSCPDEFVPTDTPGLPTTEKGPVVFRHCTEFIGGTYGGGGEVTCVAFVEQVYEFLVEYRPKDLGEDKNCAIIVHLKGGTTREIGVKGTGILPPHVAQISPASRAINFQGVNQGLTSIKIPITVTSAGSGTLAITSATLDDGGGKFLNDNPGALAPHVLQNGQTTTYGIQCRPNNTLGAFTGRLTLTTDDPSAASVVVTFTCQGIESAVAYDQICIDDVPGDGVVETLVGEEVLITLELSNITGSTATFVNVDLGAPNGDLQIMTSPEGQQLPIGTNTTPVVVRWLPTTPFDGDLGTIVLDISGEPAPRVISIAPSAIARLAFVTSDLVPEDAPVVDFGAQCIGAMDRKTFAMRGGSDPAIHADYVVGSLSAVEPPFVVRQVGTAVGVNPMTEVIVEVDVQPAQLGSVEQTVTVQTDSPTTPSYPVTLRVEGLLPGPTVSPSELTFQRTVVTGYTNTQTGVFRNCTTEALQIQDVLLDGASSADFLVTRVEPIGVGQASAGMHREPPFTLGINERVEIDVQMLPRSDGVKAARIVVGFQESNAQPATTSIALFGEAFANLANRDSYYRCSTGGPAALWPLLFVLWLVVRRRR